MTKQHVRGTRLAMVAACLMASAGASAQTFAAKPGAWENTITTSGLTIPPEILAKMPPERRAMVEQNLGSSGVGQPQVHKACITKEDLDKGFMPDRNSTCTVRTVSRTATKLVMSTACTSPAASSGTMSWEAKTPESVVGDIDQDAGGRKVHIHVVGKWLGASCDGIAPLPTGK